MVPVSYHDFFGGCATVAGALIGLLFVAISVSPEKLAGDKASADHQVKAGAAFSALVNTLVMALIALLPGVSLGPACIALAVAGLATTAGLVILLWREHRREIQLSQVSLLLVLLVLYGLELVNGFQLNGSARHLGTLNNQALLAIGFFLFAIARAWQIVGARSTSLLSTVAGLAAMTHGSRGGADQAPDAGPASGHQDTG